MLKKIPKIDWGWVLLISLVLILKTFSYFKKKINFINRKKAKYLIIILSCFIAAVFFLKNNLKNNHVNQQKNVSNKVNVTNQPKKIISPTLTFTLSLTPTTISISTPTPIFYPVVKVIDGDTIDININNQTKRVRIIGINTPEVVDPRKEVECFGKEASEKAKSILIGKKVRLEEDPTQGNTDKYGRLLRYIFLEDGTDFGLLMIKEGYAYEYTYRIPYKYQEQYKQAQKEAAESKRGLWQDNVCVDSSPIFNLNP